ncbi:MAG: D-alanyl-D-alanine carboxypeptidase family protein [Oscillospiraceae bacterium]|nr:D-alanyl-D-alanine carboxypeptidase family protein [Oscillospiraceae bacterium]
MKIFLRIIRVILGLVLLTAFAYGLFIFAQAAPKSGDYTDLKTGEGGVPVDQSVQTPPPVAEPIDTQDGAAVEPVIPTVEPAPEPTPLPDTPEGRAAALGLPAPPDIDIDSWEFVLVNADNPLPADYEPEQFGYINLTLSERDVQTNYNPNRVDSRVDLRIAQALVDFCGAAKDALKLDIVYLTSCYRSYQYQADNFRRVCINNGIADGKDKNGFYITMPAGCSEHQSGLCADIIDYWRTPLRAADLHNIPLEVWLRENCQDYGFILRFPEGKESITGVMYEPWHFRYVGVPAAKYIMENGLCLEEFVELYRGPAEPKA